MNKPIFYGNLKETSKKAADIIAQSINKLLSTQGQVVLGIPGGRSVSRIFQKLKGKNIPWKKVHIFMIDERMVNIEDVEGLAHWAKYAIENSYLLDDVKSVAMKTAIDNCYEAQIPLWKNFMDGFVNY